MGYYLEVLSLTILQNVIKLMILLSEEWPYKEKTEFILMGTGYHARYIKRSDIRTTGKIKCVSHKSP